MVSLTRTQLALLLVPLLALLTLAGSRLAGVGANEGPARADAARADRRRRAVTGAGRGSSSTSSAPSAGRGSSGSCEGARVADAVARAGGPTPRAELAAVNLAAPLADGQQVARPASAAPPAAAPPARSGQPPGRRSASRAATVEQLDELPGIGPVTAQKIVDWRAAHGPFRSVDDLDDVPGIGPARIEQLRELVTP